MAVRQPRGTIELPIEGRTCLSRLEYTERRPLGTGRVRRGVGWEVSGVNRDVPTSTLKQPRGGEAHHPAANHRRLARFDLRGLVNRQVRGPPGKGDSPAAVPIVVNHELVANSLGAKHEPRGPIGPEPNHGSNDPVTRDGDRSKPRRPGERDMDRIARRARTASRGQRRGGRAEKRSAVSHPRCRDEPVAGTPGNKGVFDRYPYPCSGQSIRGSPSFTSVIRALIIQSAAALPFLSVTAFWVIELHELRRATPQVSPVRDRKPQLDHPASRYVGDRRPGQLIGD